MAASGFTQELLPTHAARRLHGASLPQSNAASCGVGFPVLPVVLISQMPG